VPDCDNVAEEAKIFHEGIKLFNDGVCVNLRGNSTSPDGKKLAAPANYLEVKSKFEIFRISRIGLNIS